MANFNLLPQTRIRKVIADEGPMRGQQVGAQRDWKDGRMDARVGRTFRMLKVGHLDLASGLLHTRNLWTPGDVRFDAGAVMAITASGKYYTTEKARYDGTDAVHDLTNDVIKYALYTNSLTPNFSTDTAYGAAPYTSNEVPNGSGYTTGGATLGTKTISESPTGTLMFDAADPQWTTSTFNSVRGGLVYDNTLATKYALAFHNYGADYGVSGGTLTVLLASTGVWYEDVTP